MSARERAHRVVIVGGGFGGLQAARGLRRAGVEITLIDRRNFHLFQPLTYQVATGALSPGEVAYPLRAVFKRNRNVRVLLAEVGRFDLERREVVLRSVAGLPAPEPVSYDTLIVAGGSHYSYFGHDEWSVHAAEVKSLESALTVRSRILAAFEAAEIERDPGRRAEWLTFAVVGGGPTGVEMAGQIAELARNTLRSDFSTADPRGARILLIEAADRVLTGFEPSLSAKAERSLRRLGVTPVLGSTVVGVDGTGVTIAHADDATRRMPARTIVWAAGVTASGLASDLAKLTGAEQDRAGRVTVEPDLTLPGHPEVFALGDMVRVRTRNGTVITLPGVAPVAMQQGRHAASAVRARLQDHDTSPFRYQDKGNLATIGRSAAVADIRGVKVGGFLAWMTWLVVHLFYLVGFQNRLLVLIRWSISFATRGRGARLITDPTDSEPPEQATARRQPETTRSHAMTAASMQLGCRLDPQPVRQGRGGNPRKEGRVSTDSKALVEEGTPRYLAGGDPGLADYYPAWLDNLADDATVEGSMLDGAVQGAEAVRTIVVAIRTMYGDSQEFHFTAPCGDNGWLEDYIARVDDKPLGCVVLVTRNTAGQTQHVVASYRPVSTVLSFSRLLREKFAGTPYAKYFLDAES